MTLSALGIFSAAGAGGAVAASSYELIETQILTGNQASITFSSLGTYSSTYKHLQIRASAKSTQYDNMFMRLNGDTGSNYAYHRLIGSGSAVSSLASTSQTSMVCGIHDQESTPNVIDLLDVYSTTKNKTIRSIYGVAPTTIRFNSGLWMSTASLTSILLLPTTTLNFTSGSRFSLYGLK